LRPASQARKVSALRACFRYLAFQGWVAASPVTVPALPTTGDRQPAVIERAAMDQALTRPFRAAFRDHRDYAMLSVLYGGGLRLGELVGLNLSHLDLERQTACVTGPGGQRRVAPLGAAAVAALRSYLRQRAELMVGLDITHVDAGAVFVNRHGRRLERRTVQRSVARQLAAVGAAGRRSPGTLRHTYAAHMIAAGADVAAVNRLLGRGGRGLAAGPPVTPVARLRQVYAQAHPRALGGRPPDGVALLPTPTGDAPTAPDTDP
jgi:site-specific recombinase XerD